LSAENFYGENPEWFHATIGGLGLTGLITWAAFQLRAIDSSFIQMESIKFGNLTEFFAISEDSDRDFEYTVAWVDCLGKGSQLGRGLFQRANHAAAQSEIQRAKSRELSVPLTPPFSLINSASLRVFNTLYYHRPRTRRSVQRFDTFFYPLDGISNWNRLYGPRGLYQYQCVIPSRAPKIRRVNTARST